MPRVIALLACGVLAAVMASSAGAQTAGVSFAPRIDISVGVGTGPKDVLARDLDNDGFLDIATANNDTNTVTVVWGTGKGTFAATGSEFVVGYYPASIKADLVTSDTTLDLVTANEDSNSVSVLPGTGDPGTPFGTAIDTDTGLSPETVVVADFDGNGTLDVATADLIDNTVTIQMGGGNGSFTNAHSIPVGIGPPNAQTGGPTGLAAGKLVGGDQVLDLAVSLNDLGTVVVLQGNGDGNFLVPNCSAQPVPAGCLTVGTSPAGVAVGDLNGDGFDDIVVANEESDNVSVLINNRNGTFAAAVNLYTGPISGAEAVAIADLNGDGLPDIVSANSGSDNIAVFRGKSGGGFEAALFFDVPKYANPFAVAVTDADGDGQPDVFVADRDADSVSLLLNRSAGGGTPSPTTTTPMPTATPTPSPTATGTVPTPAVCTGDCNDDHHVTVDELVKGVNIALGTEALSDCPQFDKSGDHKVTVDELVVGVNNALNGCAQ